MLLLGLDTASAAVSVALHDGSSVLATRASGASPRHAELLSPLIAEVLAEAGATPADLTRIVAGVGPGPFTGLRIGLVTAQVLGATLGIDVDGVCSLDAVAVAASRVLPPGQFLVATDARRREVYWARYAVRGPAGSAPVRLAGPSVNLPAEVDHGGLPVVGRGAELYPQSLAGGVPGVPPDPSAADLVQLALHGAPYLLPPRPLYLRRPDAVPGVPKRVR